LFGSKIWAQPDLWAPIRIIASKFQLSTVRQNTLAAVLEISFLRGEAPYMSRLGGRRKKTLATLHPGHRPGFELSRHTFSGLKLFP
jgi:hypothetical protein